MAILAFLATATVLVSASATTDDHAILSRRLEAFLETHAATMARTTLRAALEHFEPERRAYFMGLRAAVATPQPSS